MGGILVKVVSHHKQLLRLNYIIKSHRLRLHPQFVRRRLFKIMECIENKFSLIYNEKNTFINQEISNDDSLTNYQLASQKKVKSDFEKKDQIRFYSFSENKIMKIYVMNSNNMELEIDNMAFIENLSTSIKKIIFVNEYEFEFITLETNSIRLWQLWFGQQNQYQFDKHEQKYQISDLVASKSMVYGCEYQIYCWNFKLELRWRSLQDNKEKFNCLDIHEDILYLGSILGSISTFDIQKQQIIYSFKPHQSKITSIKYIFQLEQVLTTSEDATIKLTQKNKEIRSVQEDLPILFLRINQEQTIFIIGTSKYLSLYFLNHLEKVECFLQLSDLQFLEVDFKKLEFYFIDNYQLERSQLSIKRIVRALQTQLSPYPLQISYNQQLIFIGDSNGRVVLWNIQTKKEQYSWQTELTQIHKLQLQGNFILVGQRLFGVQIYNYKKKELYKQILNQEIILDNLEFNQHNQILYLYNNNIQVFDIDSSLVQMIQIPKQNQKFTVKDYLLSSFGETEYFLIFNLRELATQYNLSFTQLLQCFRANIKNARITTKQTSDLTILFRQKGSQN